MARNKAFVLRPIPREIIRRSGYATLEDFIVGMSNAANGIISEAVWFGIGGNKASKFLPDEPLGTRAAMAVQGMAQRLKEKS